MALASDSTTQYDSSGYTNSLTFSHTTSGTNRGMLLAVACRQMSDVSGATYNGTSMTQEVESVNANVSGSRIYSLIAPDTGANNVVVSLGAYRLISAFAQTMTGVDQTDMVEDTGASSSVYDYRVDANATTTLNGGWLWGAINLQNNYALTPTGTTELNDTDHSDSNLGRFGVAYTEVTKPAQAFIGFSWDTQDNANSCVVAVKPASAASAPTQYKYPIFGSNHFSLSNTATRYNAITANAIGWSSSTGHRSPFGVATYISNFKFVCASAPGSGKTWTVTLLLDGVATDISVAITGTNTDATDSTHTLLVLPGQAITVQVTPTSSPSIPAEVYWYCDAHTADAQPITSYEGSAISNTTVYTSLWGDSDTTTTEGQVSIVVPCDGVLSDLYTYSPSTGNNSLTATVVKNGSDTSLASTIAANTNYGVGDTANSVSVSAGDLISVKLSTLATNTLYVAFGLAFTPTTAGDGFIGFGANNVLNNSATEYTKPAGSMSWGATETEKDARIGDGFVATAIYARINQTANGTFTFTLRKNASDTALTVAVTGTTVGSGTDSIDISDGDEFSIKAVPSDTPTGSNYANIGILIREPSSGATIAPNDMSAGLSLDATTITQNHIISTNDMSLSLSADTTTIIQNHSLSAQDMSIALSEDTTTISQVHILVSNDALISLVADNTSITQDHIVNPDDGSMGLSIDTLAITQEQIIAVASVIFGLSLDATTIAQVNSISVDDVTMQLYSDNTSLLQIHEIMADAATMNMNIDNASITQNHDITADDLPISMTEDATTLLQDQTINPDDLSSSQSLDTTGLYQVHNVTSQDLTAGLSLSQTSIVQLHIILPQDIVTTMAIDAATVSSVYLITPDGMILSGTIDNSTVTQVQAITPASMVVGQSLDNATVLQAHVIIPDDVLMSLSTDKTTITTKTKVVGGGHTLISIDVDDDAITLGDNNDSIIIKINSMDITL